MKVSLNDSERELLHRYVGVLQTMALHARDENASRVARKMRWKFHGAASYTNLTSKERVVLTDMLSYVLSKMTDLAAASPEATLIQTVLEKL